MIRHSIAFVILTLLTQIGGVIWLICLALTRRFWRFLGLFILLYAAATVAIRYIAPLTAREPLACIDAGPGEVASLSPFYCVLNRAYATPQMHDYADALATHMHVAYPGTRTRALDAGFPFLNGFPMLPHLSHRDGNALDLAFYYTDAAGDYQPGRARWFLGYWGYEQPGPDDSLPCFDFGGTSLRWDMEWLQPQLRPLQLDVPRMQEALTWLVNNPPAGSDLRIFIEPHVSERLGVTDEAIGFQGCAAARHDDHVHIQFNLVESEAPPQ